MFEDALLNEGEEIANEYIKDMKRLEKKYISFRVLKSVL